MQTKDALQNLGLNDKEAAVYMALLKLGRSSAYVIADTAGIKKPTTYVILDELIKKGVASRVLRTRKQLYEPKPPEELFAEAQERLRLSQSALPELKALYEKPEQKFRTLYFEGEKGIRAMMDIVNKRMRGKEIIGFYAKVAPESRKLDEYFREMNEDRKRIGITLRGMTPDDPSLDWYRERIDYFGSRMKFLNTEDYSSDVSLEIGDGFVQIVSLRHLQGIHIENPDIAEQVRQIFEMLWKCRLEEVKGDVNT